MRLDIKVPSVFLNIFLSHGTVIDNCVAISFTRLSIADRGMGYQFHLDAENDSPSNDDYQLDYQVIPHSIYCSLYNVGRTYLWLDHAVILK